MSRRKFYTLACLLTGGMLVLTLCLPHGQAQTSEQAPAEADAEVLEFPALPAELDDPAFHQYVDISLLETAWADLDAELLTDVALQLAAGEKVLMRSHKAGSAAELLELAAGVAAKSGDKAAVARITKAAAAHGLEDLQAQLASAQKMAGASRAVKTAVNVSADQDSAEDFLSLKEMLRDIRAAELLGDRELLEAMQEALDDLDGLTAERKEHLQAAVAKALADLPGGDAQTNSMGATIKKLEGESRSHGRNIPVTIALDRNQTRFITVQGGEIGYDDVLQALRGPTAVVVARANPEPQWLELLVPGVLIVIREGPAGPSPKYEVEFDLAVPGSNVKSRAYFAGRMLRLTQQDEVSIYERAEKYDGPTHIGYFCHKLQRPLAWPRNDQGPLRMGRMTSAAGTVAFQEGRMQIVGIRDPNRSGQ